MSERIIFVACRRRGFSPGADLIANSTASLEPELKPCSHLAVIVKRTLVIESTMTTGVRIIPYSHWSKKQQVIYAFEYQPPVRISRFLSDLLDKLWGVGYDWTGILYFGWRLALRIVFGSPLPSRNLWESPKRRFCVELFGDKLGMTSPIQMVARWKRDPQLKEIQFEETET